jgi:hypothetical protein
VHGVVACKASNATCEGCFGAFNSSGAASNRAAMSAGKYACNCVAVHVSPHRTISVRTRSCASRFGAPLIA